VSTLFLTVSNKLTTKPLGITIHALTGSDIVIVPYKGASAVLTDLLGGQIQVGFETTSVLFGHLNDNKIKPALQSVPGIAEVASVGNGDQRFALVPTESRR